MDTLTNPDLAAGHPFASSGQHLELIEQLAGLGSWEISLHTDAITWSREQQRIHGVDATTMPRTHTAFMKMVHPDDVEIINTGMAELEHGAPVTVEFRIIRPDGQVRLLQARGLLQRDAEGSPAWVRGTSLDITERRATEAALRASEESYRTIFQHASDAMWLHDIDTGAFLAVNEAACQMYGFSMEEQLQLGVAGLSAGVAPYRLEDALAFITRAVAGEPQRFEWLGKHKNGGTVWGEVRLRRVRLNGVDRILATARDINDRVSAERALRDSYEQLERRVEERTQELAASNAALELEVAGHTLARKALSAREEHFRRLIEESNDYVMIVDASGAVTSVGSSVERVLGYHPDEMIGLRPDAQLHPDDIAQAGIVLADVLAHPGLTRTLECRIRHKNGSWRVIEAIGRTVSPTSVEEGIVVNARDITERLNVERAVRERDERFRQIIENAADFVMTCDKTGALTYVGPSSLKMLGYEPNELLGTRPIDLLHPDDVARTMRELEVVVRNPGQSITSTFRIRRKDGSYVVMENVGRTMSPHSPDEGVIAFGRDVTGRRQAEEALARAKEEAERANRAKSEFLSRMSHELRTPMNSILGFAQLLARGELSPQNGKSVQHILKAGRHLLHLINEVLEIARIEAGREQFSLEPVLLAPVLEEALGLVRPLAHQHGVTLRGDAWPAELYVHADRQRLLQVLLNLLSNAIKYNQPGGTVDLYATGDATQRCRIRVRDSGKGIAAERVDELFTPFARLGAEQSEVEGTGLGLALSRRLCEAMGGQLSLEHSGTNGSTFVVELDATISPLAEFVDAERAPTERAAYRDATLLYIEDNLANLALVETILLSRPGWRVVPALQGQLGLELAREHQPDVILLDVHLPDLSGLEVLRRLRSETRTASTPVVVVSADATSASVERLRSAGANAYLTKPLDVDEFLSVLDRYIPIVEPTR